MARVTGPLMSIDASGTIAGAIVFAKWRGRNYVRRHAVPSNPRTDPQLAARSIIAYLGSYWASIPTIDQATWEPGAEARKISSFNQFISLNARNWRDLLPPSHAYPAARLIPGGLPGVMVCTVTGRQISTAMSIIPGASDWAVVLCRSLAPGTSPTPANAVQIATAVGAPMTFVDGPLAPGTYYYNAIVLSVDGGATTPGTEDSGIVV